MNKIPNWLLFLSSAILLVYGFVTLSIILGVLLCLRTSPEESTVTELTFISFVAIFYGMIASIFPLTLLGIFGAFIGFIISALED